MNKQFFLIISGPSCGGKSSVTDVLKAQLPNTFIAKLDTIKWLITDYSSGRYFEVLNDMLQSMIDVAFQHGMPVIKDGLLEHHNEYKQLADKHNIPTFFANISAPREVLQERVNKRLEAKKQGAQIANIDPARFERLQQIYERNKVETPLEFDSSVLTPEEIAAKIMEHIQNS